MRSVGEILDERRAVQREYGNHLPISIKSALRSRFPRVDEVVIPPALCSHCRALRDREEWLSQELYVREGH